MAYLQSIYPLAARRIAFRVLGVWSTALDCMRMRSVPEPAFLAVQSSAPHFNISISYQYYQ